jgi:hypothetical protein
MSASLPVARGRTPSAPVDALCLTPPRARGATSGSTRAFSRAIATEAVAAYDKIVGLDWAMSAWMARPTRRRAGARGRAKAQLTGEARNDDRVEDPEARVACVEEGPALGVVSPRCLVRQSIDWVISSLAWASSLMIGINNMEAQDGSI